MTDNSVEKNTEKKVNQQNIPKLRFKEFSGDWNNIILDDVVKFSKGKSISKNDISKDGIECVRYGELYTTYNEIIDNVISKTNLNENELVLSDKNDIVIPCSGETAIDLATASCITKDHVAIGGDITIIKTNQYAPFIAYYLNQKKTEIAKYAQGVSVVHLYSKDFKILKMKIPSIFEQEKIISFVEKIAQRERFLKQKYEYFIKFKKYLLQNIFVQKLRFENYNEEWIEYSLGEIGTTYGGLSGLTKNDFNKGNSFFIPYKNVFDNNIIDTTFLEPVELNNKHQNQVQKGDLFFTGSSETPEEVGMVSVLTEELTKCYLNSFCFGYRLKEPSNFNSEFLAYYLRSPLLRNKIKILAQGSTRFNISKKELMKL